MAAGTTWGRLGPSVNGRHSTGDLERWAADARARDAAEARARERWLRTQAEEEATLAGVLLDMAEQERSVTLHTTAGRSYAGRVQSVGEDFVAISTGGAPVTLVALSAVAVLRPEGAEPRRATVPATAPDDGWSPATDPGSGRALGVGLADVLAQAAGHRPRVSIDVADQTVVGDLRTVGADVLTIRAAGRSSERPGLAVISLQSVSAISLLDSG